MKYSTPIRILFLLLIAIIGWNYWLSFSLEMYNKVTQSGTMSLRNVDFYAYYHAGSRTLQGVEPYFWGKDAQNRPIISDYIYPPAILPIFSLLALMPYDLARTVWLIAYGLSYILLLVWTMLSFAREWRETFMAIGLGFTLASFPLVSHIQHGQIDIFIICLMLACYLLYARGKKWSAAILLAVATLIKVSPGFLLLYFILFQRDLRFLLKYVISGTALAGISLFFVPINWYLDYVRYVIPEIGKGDAFWLSQSLLKYLAFSPGLSRAVGIGGLVLLAVLFFFISRRYTAMERRPALPLGGSGITSELVFMLNLSGILIVLAKAWVAAYVWLIIPSAWLAIILLTHKVRIPLLAGFCAGVGLVLAKVYGYPILESLNLWGGMLLTTCLAISLLAKPAMPLRLPTTELPLQPK